VAASLSEFDDVPCYDTHRVIRGRDGQLNWRANRYGVPGPGEHLAAVPCGRCVGCKAAGAKAWAVRCYHEGLLHSRFWSDGEVSAQIPHGCIVTLTYNEPALRRLCPDRVLNHAHFKAFWRRLRRKFGSDPRFFMCGEYGGKTARPHFHAILWKVDFDDVEQVELPDGQRVQMSPTLTKLWSDSHGPLGYATYDSLSFHGSGYVAGYVAKKMTATLTEADMRRHVEVTDPETGRPLFVDPGPEYRKMSRDPGIGLDWIRENLDIVYPADVVSIGKYTFRPPGAYDRVLRDLDPTLHRQVLEARLEGEASWAEEWTPSRERAAKAIFLSESNASRREDVN
jgi:hypothetical protein